MRLRALRRRAPCTPGERRGAPGEAGRDHGGHPDEGASRGRGPSSVRRLPQALRLGPEARVVVPSLGHRHPQQPVGGNALPRWAAGALGPIPCRAVPGGRQALESAWCQRWAEPRWRFATPSAAQPSGSARSCEWTRCSLRAPSKLRSCALNLREFSGFGRFSWMSGTFPCRSGAHAPALHQYCSTWACC